MDAIARGLDQEFIWSLDPNKQNSPTSAYQMDKNVLITKLGSSNAQNVNISTKISNQK